MAETQAAPDANAKTSPKGKSKLPLILVAAIVLIAVAVGGWMWRRSASSSNKAAPAPKKIEVTSTLHLDSFVVNLQDASGTGYLRVGIDLGLAGAAKEGEKEGSPPYLPRLRDAILTVLGTRSVDELLTADGKAKLKADLLSAINGRVPELDCKEVYFTEFLVQH